MKFNIDQQTAIDKKATFTINEIYQQPEVWKKVVKLIKDNTQAITSFFAKIKAKNPVFVFTGSGTSGFVGDSLTEFLNEKNWNTKSVHATNILSNPNIYFKKEQTTVLVSFARSGNSPESVGAVDVLKTIVDDNYQIIITCNQNGHLYKNFKDDDKALILLMPEETNDQSFAMTSSYSSMLLTAALIFMQNTLGFEKEVEQLINATACMLDNEFGKINKLALEEYDRIVYLGSNILYGFAEECALKVLELTAGKVVSVYNTNLGFRHGPKSIVNDKTLIVVMMSSNRYTRLYDFDLLKEVFNDGIAKKVICLDNQSDPEVAKYAHEYYAFNQTALNNDLLLGLEYVVWGQMFGLFKSLALNNTPDNPCPTGEVNRVVKGVVVHKFNK